MLRRVPASRCAPRAQPQRNEEASETPGKEMECRENERGGTKHADNRKSRSMS